MDCGQRLLTLPGSAAAALGSGAACEDFGPSALMLELSASMAAVSDGACARSGGRHGLGAGPLQLYIGSNCSAADCPGEGPLPLNFALDATLHA
jgi:hypothetical protein